MGLHTDLPIYKVAYDLFDTSTELAKNMPRDFKQSVGGKLRDECLSSLFTSGQSATSHPGWRGTNYPPEICQAIVTRAALVRKINRRKKHEQNHR